MLYVSIRKSKYMWQAFDSKARGLWKMRTREEKVLMADASAEENSDNDTQQIEILDDFGVDGFWVL